MTIEDIVIQREFVITYSAEPNPEKDGQVYYKIGTFQDARPRFDDYANFEGTESQLKSFGLDPTLPNLYNRKVLITLTPRKIQVNDKSLKSNMREIKEELKENDFSMERLYLEEGRHRSVNTFFPPVQQVLIVGDEYIKKIAKFKQIRKDKPGPRVLSSEWLSQVSFSLGETEYQALKQLPADYVMSLSIKLVDEEKK